MGPNQCLDRNLQEQIGLGSSGVASICGVLSSDPSCSPAQCQGRSRAGAIFQVEYKNEAVKPCLQRSFFMRAGMSAQLSLAIFQRGYFHSS